MAVVAWSLLNRARVVHPTSLPIRRERHGRCSRTLVALACRSSHGGLLGGADNAQVMEEEYVNSDARASTAQGQRQGPPFSADGQGSCDAARSATECHQRSSQQPSS